MYGGYSISLKLLFGSALSNFKLNNRPLKIGWRCFVLDALKVILLTFLLLRKFLNSSNADENRVISYLKLFFLMIFSESP